MRSNKTLFRFFSPSPLFFVASVVASPLAAVSGTQQQQLLHKKPHPLLDPPFSPVLKDERQQQQQRAGDDGSNKAVDFSVLCGSCRTPIFNSDARLLGYPAWPTFHSVLDTGLLKLVTDDVRDLSMTRTSNDEEQEQQEDEATDTLLPSMTEKKTKSPQRSRSLILREDPPVMRWGMSAAVGREEHDRISRGHRTFDARERRKAGRGFRGAIAKSKQLATVRHLRAAPAVCRGFCSECDSFVCVVVHGSKDSQTGVRFVVNPSCVIFR